MDRSIFTPEGRDRVWQSYSGRSLPPAYAGTVKCSRILPGPLVRHVPDLPSGKPEWFSVSSSDLEEEKPSDPDDKMPSGREEN